MRTIIPPRRIVFDQTLVSQSSAGQQNWTILQTCSFSENSYIWSDLATNGTATQTASSSGVVLTPDNWINTAIGLSQQSPINVLVLKMHETWKLTNPSNVPITLEIYKVTPRQSITQGMFGTTVPLQLFMQDAPSTYYETNGPTGTTAGTIPGSLDPQWKPYMNWRCTKYFKWSKPHVLDLPPGSQYSLNIEVPKQFTLNRYKHSQLASGGVAAAQSWTECQIKGLTINYVVVQRGTLTHIPGTASNAGYTATECTFYGKTKIEYTILPNPAPQQQLLVTQQSNATTGAVPIWPTTVAIPTIP